MAWGESWVEGEASCDCGASLVDLLLSKLCFSQAGHVLEIGRRSNECPLQPGDGRRGLVNLE